MLTKLALLTLISLAIVNGKTTNRQHWKKIGKDVKCKEGLNNLDLASELLDLLNNKQCPMINLQCVAAYNNPYVNLPLFQMQTSDPQDAQFVIEVLCYKGPGQLKNSNGNTSFLEFVADTELKKVTETQIDTFTFYPDLQDMSKYDKDFVMYYNVGARGQTSVGIVAIALAVPVILQYFF
ncbi:uncharacterized protein LOC134851376 [Symsagittifera roscoffensis]|uniref:uncharacterized protein LOC134851376 n=1 Tax=Symsagittifera roscoffensis TaxID=84072 RepID=UPI00307B3AA3